MPPRPPARLQRRQLRQGCAKAARLALVLLSVLPWSGVMVAAATEAAAVGGAAESHLKYVDIQQQLEV